MQMMCKNVEIETFLCLKYFILLAPLLTPLLCLIIYKDTMHNPILFEDNNAGTT